MKMEKRRRQHRTPSSIDSKVDFFASDQRVEILGWSSRKSEKPSDSDRNIEKIKNVSEDEIAARRAAMRAAKVRRPQTQSLQPNDDRNNYEKNVDNDNANKSYIKNENHRNVDHTELHFCDEQLGFPLRKNRNDHEIESESESESESKSDSSESESESDSNDEDDFSNLVNNRKAHFVKSSDRRLLESSRQSEETKMTQAQQIAQQQVQINEREALFILKKKQRQGRSNDNQKKDSDGDDSFNIDDDDDEQDLPYDENGFLGGVNTDDSDRDSDCDCDCDNEEYLFWNERELDRLKRDRNNLEKERREEELLEQRRKRSDAEAIAELESQREKEKEGSRDENESIEILQSKGGAFFLERGDDGEFLHDIYKRRLKDDTLSTSIKHSQFLPHKMRVPNYGRKGKTKAIYTTTAQQDTSRQPNSCRSLSSLTKK